MIKSSLMIIVTHNYRITTLHNYASVEAPVIEHWSKKDPKLLHSKITPRLTSSPNYVRMRSKQTNLIWHFMAYTSNMIKLRNIVGSKVLVLSTKLFVK